MLERPPPGSVGLYWAGLGSGQAMIGRVIVGHAQTGFDVPVMNVYISMYKSKVYTYIKSRILNYVIRFHNSRRARQSNSQSYAQLSPAFSA